MNDKGWFTAKSLLLFLAIGGAGFLLRKPIGSSLGLNERSTLFFVLWAVTTAAIGTAYFSEKKHKPPAPRTIVHFIATAAVGIMLLIWLGLIFLLL